jgi:hypothetical protein
MPILVQVFVILWVLALMTWLAGIVCYVRARRHYIGPKGLLPFIFPIGRLRPSNYTAEGASILRWQFLFMIVFLCLVGIGIDIGKLEFPGLPR